MNVFAYRKHSTGCGTEMIGDVGEVVGRHENERIVFSALNDVVKSHNCFVQR